MSSEERCPDRIEQYLEKYSLWLNDDARADLIMLCNSFYEEGHSPAPVDAPALAGFVYHDKVNCDNHCTEGACKCCCHPKAPAPAEGAAAWMERVHPKTGFCSTTMEEYAAHVTASLCEQLAQVRRELLTATEDLKLAHRVELDMHERIAEAQRELKEALRIIGKGTQDRAMLRQEIQELQDKLLARSSGTKERGESK